MEGAKPGEGVRRASIPVLDSTSLRVISWLKGRERFESYSQSCVPVFREIPGPLCSPGSYINHEGEMPMKRVGAKKGCAFLGFVFAVLMMNACAITGGGFHVGGPPPQPAGGPPPHAPAHGYRAKYKYHYYPTAYVYFDVTRNVYFYLEGTAWRTAVVLPEVYRVKIREVEYVMIDMDDDRPYVAFEEHKKKFPPGQMKKKGKKN